MNTILFPSSSTFTDFVWLSTVYPAIANAVSSYVSPNVLPVSVLAVANSFPYILLSLYFTV